MPRLPLQNNLDAVIKETITPIMKMNYFKKAARNYSKKLNGFGQCFNIQSSLFNDFQEIKFTFNTGIFIPQIYELYYHQAAPSFPKEINCFHRLRIGQLLKGNDYRYSFTVQTKMMDLSQIIELHLNRFIMPHFSRFNSIDDIISILYDQKEFGKGPDDYAFLSGLLLLNNRKIAKRTLQ